MDRTGERGVALLTALLLMLAVLMTSIAAARTAISGARAAAHERDRMLALHGAMAALADAERDIEGGADPASARAAALAGADPSAFADDCRASAPYQGLCARGGDALFTALADPDGPAVALGTFTEARFADGEGALASAAPRYLIESMPSVAGAVLYRITALGFGSAAAMQVALQAYYRKLASGASGAPGAPGAPAAAPPPGAPSGGLPAPAPATPGPGAGTPGGSGMRVGWRELGNWHAAIAAAHTEQR